MNNLNLNQTGGLPLSTNILEAMQTAYSVLNAFGNMAGNLAIISGCDITGNNVSDGAVFIDGELLEFRGSALGVNVIIRSDFENENFENGTSKAVIETRYATFGTAVTNYSWANFKRAFPTTQIKTFKDDHEARLLKLEKSVPIGLVAVWGKTDPIPEGWVAYTFLQGKTPVGRKAGDPNFSVLGSTVGSAEVTLDISQMPSHNHNISPGVISPGGSGSNLLSISNNVGHTITSTTQSKGSGQPHSNIQPSGIVDFIIFVGF